jgi:hypothetical protein
VGLAGHKMLIGGEVTLTAEDLEDDFFFGRKTPQYYDWGNMKQ